MVTILMISAKLVSPALLKLMIFQNKGYDVIILEYEVTNKNLSRESNYVVDVGMCPKFRNCSISMRKVIVTSML